MFDLRQTISDNSGAGVLQEAQSTDVSARPTHREFVTVANNDVVQLGEAGHDDNGDEKEAQALQR